MIEGLLFDLDGVIIDSEPQYNIFWGNQFAKYYPETPELHWEIKGQTLTEIYARFFTSNEIQEVITEALNQFEATMPMPYVKGFCQFIEEINHKNIKTCIVTSSNTPKMQSVFSQHPELKGMITTLLASEDFTRSKPDPECYINAAKLLGVNINHCIAFEDSMNGLRSAKSSGAKVVGLATSLEPNKMKEYCDIIIPDFSHVSIGMLEELLS